MGAGASWTMAPIGGVGCSPMVVTWATVDGIIGCGMPPGGWGDGLGASIGWLMAC